MKKKSQVWIGGKDLTKDSDFMVEATHEFKDNIIWEDGVGRPEVAESMKSNRRDFLKYLGFGIGAATLAASCDIPVKRAIPYLVKPDEIVPGVATYYASSYVKGGEFCSVLVKTREGRPIKIEGNDMCPVTHGGTTARTQASVLELYDTNRLKSPAIRSGKSWSDTSWADLDAKVISGLKAGNKIRIVTHTMMSPTGKKALAKLVAMYPGAKVITYDPVSSAAILAANETTFGDRVIPNYKFQNADVIVTFDADFLGNWISPTEYSYNYAKNRVIKDVKNPKLSRLIALESGMSLTGSNADNRILIKPSEQGAAIAYLYNQIVGSGAPQLGLNNRAKDLIAKVAVELKGARGKSLIISGSNNKAEQILINGINNALGNYGHTIEFSRASMQRQGDEKDLANLLNEMNSNSVDVLLFNDCNPAYDYAQGSAFENAMKNVKLKVSMAYAMDETADKCDLVAPIHHPLESWGDVEAKRGYISMMQPTIAPLFDTRQSELSFLTWAGMDFTNSSDRPYLDYLMDNYKSESYSGSFQQFWDGLLRDGIYDKGAHATTTSFSGDISALVAGKISKPSSSKLEISFNEGTLGNGQYSNNPWLQELPSPVSRTTWGNYLAVPLEFDGVNEFISVDGLEDGAKSLKDGDLVELTVGSKTLTVPVIQQFGQMAGTMSLSLGYGRRKVGMVGNNVGVDVNDLGLIEDGRQQYRNDKVSISAKVGREKYYSSVQYHHTYGIKAEDKKTGEMINADEAALVTFGYGIVDQGFQGALVDRSVMYQTNVKDLDPYLKEIHTKREEAQHLNSQQIYNGYDHLYEQGHHWGMHIDMNTCFGCGACVIACQAENNIPVVGKERVSKHQEMAWLRIDRYFYGDIESPAAVYQPMMCQQCDNAPCENVCPVNATNHSTEGLNQMAYNRCIGTRYCANNCPYMVRRFNWLDFTTADLFPVNEFGIKGEEKPYYSDDLTRMVLNPDVTVRSRGVIEKCTFCVQRLQEGKLNAKRENRKLNDRDVKSACQTACVTGAITFGDFNNKDGELNKATNNPLNYIVLEEINVRSSVGYNIKVHNKDESYEA